MRLFLIPSLLFLITPYVLSADKSNNTKAMIDYPRLFIQIEDYSWYGTWGAVPIISHITIKNSSDFSYKDIKIQIFYYSTNVPKRIISQQIGTLKIILPPHSNDTYLKSGVPFGAGSQFMTPAYIKVLDATVVK